ncbi:high-affinity branched-chain amino acid ABC transporter ATP-binding protein LivG [Geodermatophilus sp. TF02-6]|nr:high-affinity branched-chain amino acid ABC transporter ATP-binding protein LivG [Geodermatophilus sp. TF02-6]
MSLHFGGIQVLDSVGLAVEPDTIVGLVGPNGAGKTSLFNCISGHYRPTSGSILVDGVPTLHRPPHRMAELGLSRTFQHPALQLDASVLDNVLIGAHTRLRGGALSWALRLPFTISGERRARQRAGELLDHLGLAGVADRPAGSLAHGLHKRVELARALLSEPRLLLLDEPAGGLPHAEVEQLIETIRAIRTEFGLTIVIVEHHMGLISALTDRVVVLVQGRKLLEGTALEAQRHPLVVEAYLGRTAA